VQRVLAAPADGFVQQVHVRPGDSVRAGQPLLELADQDLLLERQRWQSQLAQHLDGLAAAQARADRAQLVQLQSKADEAQAQLDLVDERLQRARLVAPFDGIVVQGDLSQQLGAPVKLGAELMTLAPSDRFRVIVEVDERDVAHLRAGQTGSVALSALPWDTLPLRVARITPVATPREGRNVFEVEAELLEQPAGLRPGLQGTARITAGEAPTLWRWSRRLVESLRLAWWEWVG
jgi:RND family efflux transporter MFP subunit